MPAAQRVFKRFAVCPYRLWCDPFQTLGNHYRRAAHFYGFNDALQVRVGQYHAAVCGLRRARELLRWRAMQPDPAAGLAAFDIELVRVVDRQGAGAVEVFEFFGVQTAGDKVHPKRRTQVAFKRFFNA